MSWISTKTMELPSTETSKARVEQSRGENEEFIFGLMKVWWFSIQCMHRCLRAGSKFLLWVLFTEVGYFSGSLASCNIIYFFICLAVLSGFSISSVAQSCLSLCDPMDCSTPGLLIHHQLPDFTQTHVHWVSNAIQPSCPLLSPSPSTFNLSQHQGLSQWVSSSHQVAKVLEFQLQHQSFQGVFRTDFL